MLKGRGGEVRPLLGESQVPWSKIYRGLAGGFCTAGLGGDSKVRAQISLPPIDKPLLSELKENLP